MVDTAAFALALDALPGVGRVTAGRIIAHFPTYDDLLRAPREQVLVRVKSAPHAEALVKQLFDEPAMRPRLEEATATLSRLAEQQVQVVAQNTEAWPAGLDDLARGERPLVLYAYGDLAPLGAPSVAILGRPPVSAPAFEQTEVLVRHLLAAGLTIVGGIAHGFDVVVHRLAATNPNAPPSVMVPHTGLARVDKSLRPAITQTVRAGGVFVSPFPMHHGPFDHDDRERALVCAALAEASVFFDPRPETPEWTAMEWALEAGRAVFGTAAEGHPLPDAVHPLTGPVDYEWVVAAAQ